jgi:RNA polymerase sigma-70 factor (ECF subfamily)
VHFLWGRVRNQPDAEDLAQDTLARAWDKLARYDPNRRLSTWLFTIAARLAIDHGRRGQHRGGTVSIDQAHSQPDGSPRPADDAAGREWRDNLWSRAADVLSEEQYTGLWLQYGEQFELKRIAEILGRTPVHMRVILLRARRTLARHLNADGSLAEASPTPAASHSSTGQQAPPSSVERGSPAPSPNTHPTMDDGATP